MPSRSRPGASHEYAAIQNLWRVHRGTLAVPALRGCAHVEQQTGRRESHPVRTGDAVLCIYGAAGVCRAIDLRDLLFHLCAAVPSHAGPLCDARDDHAVGGSVGPLYVLAPDDHDLLGTSARRGVGFVAGLRRGVFHRRAAARLLSDRVAAAARTDAPARFPRRVANRRRFHPHV